MAKNRVTNVSQESPVSMLPEAAIATQELADAAGAPVSADFGDTTITAVPSAASVGKPSMTAEQKAARMAALKMEGKDAKFVRLAKKRGVKAIKAIRQLAHLANRSQYEWTTEQAANIVRQLTSEIVAIESKFKGNKTNGVTFSL